MPQLETISKAGATSKILSLADKIHGWGALSHADSVDLAVRMAPALASAASGWPAVRKAAPPTVDQLEQIITDWFLTTRDKMRKESDQRAMQATMNSLRGSFTDLLNGWLGQ